jgi:alpha-L-fucosidase
MRNSRRNPFPAIALFLAMAVGIATGAEPRSAIVPIPETSAEREARLAWWREGRFGLFIHWGLYAIPGRGEWVQWNEQIPNEDYAKLADEFKPAHFDAAEWAQLARDAGMKYVVFTSRHHDGFAMFDDPGSEFTSMKTAAHRDFVAEYVKAVRAAGLHVGLYYSPLDWRFPGYVMPGIQRKSAEAMREQYHRQMDLLLKNYGPLDEIWFDGGESDWLSFGGDWQGSKWVKRGRGEHYSGGFDWGHGEVYAELRRLQPQAVINGRADMPEDFHAREGDGALGNFDAEHPWELCTTLVRGPWGWKPDCEVKSLATCVRFLVGAAGRDGNFLLNVGPRPDGTIDPPQAQRLREIGAWLRLNGKSIYGTRGGPWLPGDYGVSTHRENRVFVHVLQWPGQTLKLPALPAKVLKATRLDGGAISFHQDEHSVELTVPTKPSEALDTIVELELDRSSVGIAPIETVSK